MNDSSHPGQIIRKKIQQKGWNQTDLSFAVNCHEALLNRIINEKSGVSYEMSQLLGLALDEDLDYFFNLHKQFEFKA